MTREAKSKEELAITKLRMNIFKGMEECIGQNDANGVWLYAQALSQLPIYLDYKVKE